MLQGSGSCPHAPAAAYSLQNSLQQRIACNEYEFPPTGPLPAGKGPTTSLRQDSQGQTRTREDHSSAGVPRQSAVEAGIPSLHPAPARAVPLTEQRCARSFRTADNGRPLLTFCPAAGRPPAALCVAVTKVGQGLPVRRIHRIPRLSGRPLLPDYTLCYPSALNPHRPSLPPLPGADGVT
jgi:hypothetical protein